MFASPQPKSVHGLTVKSPGISFWRKKIGPAGRSPLKPPSAIVTFTLMRKPNDGSRRAAATPSTSGAEISLAAEPAPAGRYRTASKASGLQSLP